jgi:hypothetical protein
MNRVTMHATARLDIPTRHAVQSNRSVSMTTWLSLSRRSKWVKTTLVVGVAVGGFIAGCATAAQPHMQNALAALQSARSELGMAVRDKGGHLPIAITRVDEAIHQVQLGIEAGGG